MNRQPWTRHQILAVLLLALAALALLLGWPARAEAGWFDFIGDAAGAISEATWKVALIKAVERTLPSLILLVCIVGAIVASWGAGYLSMRLHETAKTALKDDTVSLSEWIVLGVLAVATLPVVAGLLWFAWFLATAAHSGLTELMR